MLAQMKSALTVYVPDMIKKTGTPKLKLNLAKDDLVDHVIKIRVEKFDKYHRFRDSSRNKFGRIWHPAANVLFAVATPFLYLNNLEGSLIPVALIYMQSGLDKMFHNIAMRKAQLLVKDLKALGITDKNDLKKAVDLYLKKNGGLFYSNLVRKFCPSHIEKVANQEKPPQLWGIVSKIRDKVTLGPFHYDADVNKAEKYFKRLYKKTINLFKTKSESKL